ncbi:tripartite motif-containing protein 16-like isoform X1 [Acipenser ruthenus]|uniref:tripartite motif-containing protein 16-like isoform X1 n=1 Tax=Acipenser ruthenus TaxID=7906 RepID=UPI002741A7D4|nr:tripartite motif-containing protein 16-like isoform X1 [Acipenser ruthenus]
MASKVWSEDRFSCPVCLELLKDPVAIPCGHSYCMGCIKNCWDQTDHTGVYSCPQCRETFTPRPDLCRNTMLAELVEELKKTGLNPPPAQSYAGPGDVPCDFCTGRKFKAVKSCLTCLASYCETHVKPHYEGAAFKRHKLINAIGDLQQKLCAEHQKVLEVFCRTDQTCICVLCIVKEHKSHDTVSAEAERSVKQKQLGETQTEIQQRIQERLKETEEIKQAVETLKRSACIEIKESEKIFTELIRSIEKIHTEVIELIGANEKAAVNQAEGRMKKLEQEIAELRRRNTELKQLSETEDHIHFLQNFQSLCAPPEAQDSSSVTVNRAISFGAVRKAVSELKDHIEDFCKGELVKITKTVNEVAVYSLQAPEPRNRAEFLKSKEKCEEEMKDQPRRRCSNEDDRPNMSGCEASAEEETGETEEQEPVNEVAVYSLQAPESRNRAEFLKYSCQLTLDPNTAYRNLCLSEGNRKVTLVWTQQFADDHPERFDRKAQVLCREGLSGTRCYWEFEWSGRGASIGVTYKGISRKGEDYSCVLGFNDKSWSLECSGSRYTARHNSNHTAITAPRSPRIGVYLDFNAGTMSFYGVSDTMTLLHRFQTTFTEPLYPGFRLDWFPGSTVTICQLN